jgi:hypothetical protein
MGRQNTDAGKKVISRLFERKMTGSGDNTVMDDIALRKPKRAALFFVEGYLGVQPSVVSAAIHLARHGYDVDLYFVRPDLAYPTPSLPAGIRLVEYSPYILDLTKCIRTIFPRSRAIDGNKAAIVTRKTTESFVRIGVRALVRKSEALINEFSKIVGFGLFCRRRVGEIDLVIAFDMPGLAVMALAAPWHVPFVYWSLEITLLSEARNLASLVLKRLEMLRLPKARAIVVQSWQRADLLAQDVVNVKERVTIVPNGPPEPRQESLPRDFFIKRFDISPTATIVLHAGMIDPIMNSCEIAAASKRWPNNFVLVFHERRKVSPTDPYLRAVQTAGGTRVFLSLDPVPFEMVDVVFAGAKIGLVCYRPINSNFATTLMSSGKLVYYLRNGLPVVLVANRPPEFADRWKCCICVPDVDEIGGALTMIASDYDRFSQQAKECYDDIFDFGRAFDRLMTLADINAVF